jgi:hypothetical protein
MMSKLTDQLKTFITNKRHPVMDTVSFSIEFKDDGYTFDREVRFTATFGSVYRIRENIALEFVDQNSTTEAIKHVKNALIQEVFGEFRTPIHQLRHAIYNDDKHRALEILSKIESTMFDE